MTVTNATRRRRRFANIIHAVYCEPWLIQQKMHQKIADILAAHISGDAHKAGGIAELFGIEEEAQPMTRMIEDVAVISIDGVIGKRVSGLEKSSGVVDVDEVEAELAKAAGDDAVRAILLDVNSPGGTVTGVPELAARVAEAGEHKRVVAYTDTMAASAAYWIASQAAGIVAAPSANVGSIGVYLPVLDESRAYEMAGLKMDVIKSGKHKGMGVPGTALSEEQRAFLQAQTTELHSMFKAAVRAARPLVADETMEGQDYYGTQAVALGLVDACGDMADALEMARL